MSFRGRLTSLEKILKRTTDVSDSNIWLPGCFRVGREAEGDVIIVGGTKKEYIKGLEQMVSEARLAALERRRE